MWNGAPECLATIFNTASQLMRSGEHQLAYGARTWAGVSVCSSRKADDLYHVFYHRYNITLHIIALRSGEGSAGYLTVHIPTTCLVRQKGAARFSSIIVHKTTLGTLILSIN